MGLRQSALRYILGLLIHGELIMQIADKFRGHGYLVMAVLLPILLVVVAVTLFQVAGPTAV